jgi:hypothetical protein
VSAHENEIYNEAQEDGRITKITIDYDDINYKPNDFEGFKALVKRHIDDELMHQKYSDVEVHQKSEYEELFDDDFAERNDEMRREMR